MDLNIRDFQNDNEVYPILYIIWVLAYVKSLRQRRRNVHLPREWWVFPRSLHRWTAMYNNVYNMNEGVRDRLWIRDFRMKYATFLELVAVLRPYIQHQDTRYREALPITKAVAMVLHKLAKGLDNVEVGEIFACGSSTVYKYTLLICHALADKDKLLKTYISLPSGVRLANIIASFHNITRPPNICGAIDGTHCQLNRKPPQSFTPGDYWCRHDIYNDLLQGVCDSEKIFWDICVRAPEGTHDAAHLRQSSFYKKLMMMEILQEYVITIGGQQILPYVVGDSAYPILTQIQKPFNARTIGNADQNAYDKNMRKGRVRIENTFGILKNRWSILKNINVGVQYAYLIMVACCVLHNFCHIKNDTRVVEGEELEDATLNDINVNKPRQLLSKQATSRAGNRIRDNLYSYWEEN